MKRYFICFLLFHAALNSQDPFDFFDSTAYSDTDCENSAVINLSGAPSSVVYGCVNVVSGDFLDQECDLVINGSTPLTFERTYSSSDHREGSLYTSWFHNHHAFIKSDPECCFGTSICFIEGSGFVMRNKDLPPLHTACTNLCAPEFQFEDGYTNCSSGEISGKTNLLNMSGEYDRKFTKAVLRDGSGNIQYFELGRNKVHLYRNRTQKADKNNIFYNLAESKFLTEIIGKNSKEALFGQITIESAKNKEEMIRSPLMSLKSDDGRIVTYHFKHIDGNFEHHVKKHRFLLSRVERPNAPEVCYAYTRPNKYSLERIKSKILPDNRFLNIEYYDEKKTYELPIGKHTIMDRKYKPFNRVYRLCAPIGYDSAPLPLATFEYRTVTSNGKIHKQNYTRVFDALNHHTDYLYHKKQQRLIDIYRYDSNNEFYCRERFIWKDSSLKMRLLYDTDKNIQFLRNYGYDINHNIKKEEIHGNLTGINFNCPKLNPHESLFASVPNINPKGCDILVKEYEYSKDGKNLLLKESNPHTTYTYGYDNDRSLLTSKFLLTNGVIRSREFYEYDASAAVTKKVVDNGNSANPNDLTGVTVRLIQKITNSKKAPLGLPLTTYELYFDPETKQELQLKKTVNKFDDWGRLIQQKVFDAKDRLKYTLSWEFDDHGNIIRETDVMGYEIHRKFDVNGNKIYEQGPSPDYYMEFVYDFSNRLIRQDEVRIDGTRLTTTFTYDLLGNKIASMDCYGNTTFYEYDPFSRLIKTTLPAVPDDHGTLYNPILTFGYDVFNNLTSHTDAAGHTFKTLYTVHGKPYYKEYPDGSCERFEYDITGALLKETAKDGSYSVYTNDALSRPTHIVRYDTSGTPIDTASKAYDSTNLIYEMDGMGIETHYRYDGAGRLIEKVVGEAKTAYLYDSSGRVWQERSYYGLDDSEFNVKKMFYDKADRLTQERTEDAHGNIQTQKKYAYDAAGNKSLVTFYNEAGISSLNVSYDPQGNPVHIVDPLGNITHITYNFSYCDKYGLTVPYSESVDANGTITVNISDAIGRTACTLKRNPLGDLIQKTEFFYDAQGNKVARKDNVMVKDELKNIITTRWEYDAFGQVSVIIEAEGTPEQRSSRYYYDVFHRIARFIKPDGVSLFYSYDAKGRLKEHRSSDSTCHYVYQYDRFDHPVKIEDRCLSLTTSRKYTSQGQLSKETLANGLSMTYDCDLMGRTSSIHYPDGTGVDYEYNGSRIAKITRRDRSERILYTHSYLEYDLSGNCLCSRMIGNAGELRQRHDLLNRVIAIETADWSEDCDGYDAVGNLARVKVVEPEGSYDSMYAYDDLYQLSKEEGWVSHNYVNDSLANHVEKDSYSQSFNSLNELLEDEKGTFVYDLNGNLIRRNREGVITEYKYDALNRLILVKTDGKTYKYTYDSFNRRIRKTEGATATNFLYAGVDEIGVVDSGGTITQLRVLGIGKGSEIGAAIAMEFNGKAYAPLHDHNGHVRVLVDATTGEISENYRYSAFGEEDHPEASKLSPWRFASKRCDAETGFIYFGERYYDPSTGRWISNDPLGFEGGPNLYSYVRNRPMSLFDLYGMLEQGGGFWENLFTTTVNFVSNCVDVAVSSFNQTLESAVNNTFFYPEMPSTHSVGSIRVAHHFVLFGNGIWNTQDTTRESAERISDYAGGREVHYMCTPSGGTLEDIGRVALTRTFNVQSMSAREWRHAFEEYFANAPPDALALALPHSEACTHLLQALREMPPEMRDRIIIRAFAPSAYFSESLCHSVVHYCSARDVVPLTDPLGGIINHDTIKYLPAPKGASWFEHPFDSLTYRETRREILAAYYRGDFAPKKKNLHQKN